MGDVLLCFVLCSAFAMHFYLCILISYGPSPVYTSGPFCLSVLINVCTVFFVGWMIQTFSCDQVKNVNGVE
jgi:hypothetical protein